MVIKSGLKCSIKYFNLKPLVFLDIQDSTLLISQSLSGIVFTESLHEVYCASKDQGEKDGLKLKLSNNKSHLLMCLGKSS